MVGILIEWSGFRSEDEVTDAFYYLLSFIYLFNFFGRIEVTTDLFNPFTHPPLVLLELSNEDKQLSEYPVMSSNELGNDNGWSVAGSLSNEKKMKSWSDADKIDNF